MDKRLRFVETPCWRLTLTDKTATEETEIQMGLIVAIR